MNNSQEIIPEFAEIRPYVDGEVNAALRELVKDPEISSALPFLFEDSSPDFIEGVVGEIHSIRSFKEKIALKVMRKLVKISADSLSLSGKSKIDPSTCYTYISNHRDIVLDAAFLNVLLFEEGKGLPRIAIGDNLMVRDWIRSIVRLCDAFLVKRSPSIRDMIRESLTLSKYIRHTITSGEESVWIAQREGRAKDSNDTTQPALLKMLAMSAQPGEDLPEALEALHITPVAISYEYDPCDYLKAQELLEKKNNPEHTKTPEDDYLNMKTGLLGRKGRIHFSIAPPLEDLEKITKEAQSKQEALQLIAKEIDRRIHLNYRLYPGNYIAHDLLTGGEANRGMYSEKEKLSFELYLTEQISKVRVPNKDKDFLRHAILTMYANPLINHIKARQS